LLLSLFAMMIYLIPAFLLDVPFLLLICLAIVVLLVAIYSMELLDFACFSLPCFLLVSNINEGLALKPWLQREWSASWSLRVGDAAGKVNSSVWAKWLLVALTLVCFVCFAIFENFTSRVVNKSAGRISEVSASIYLGCTASKQMGY